MRLSPVFILFAMALIPAEAAVAKGPSAELVDTRWQQHDAASIVTVDHEAWGAFLDRYLVQGTDGVNRVRYGAVAPEDKAALDSYVTSLESTPVSTLNRDEQMAYWINLYNAVTVKIVVEAYPVKSIRKVLSGGIFSPGPWQRDLVMVEGQALSLDDIEHGILRPIWQDNRIHYAVNCASIGCPNLMPEPFTAAVLETMLAEVARDYVNHPRGAQINDRGKLTASRIYNWYDADFGGSEQGIITHLMQHADADLAGRLDAISDINSFDYDWSLNDAK